eukprot:5791514-Amphidinium_carterae.1
MHLQSPRALVLHHFTRAVFASISAATALSLAHSMKIMIRQTESRWSNEKHGASPFFCKDLLIA